MEKNPTLCWIARVGLTAEAHQLSNGPCEQTRGDEEVATDATIHATTMGGAKVGFVDLTSSADDEANASDDEHDEAEDEGDNSCHFGHRPFFLFFVVVSFFFSLIHPYSR